MTDARANAGVPVRHAALAIATLVALVLGAWAFGDHLVDHGGPRWDAWYYTGVARTFPDLPREFNNTYQLQRIVPSILVNAGLRATGQARDDGTITIAFLVLDLLMLAGAVLLWLRLARHEGLTAAQFWLGVAGMFLTFASLRFVAFNPAMTDTAVLLLGLLLVVAYLERRPLLLAAVGVIGGFTWPVVTITAVPLLLFPRGSTLAEASDPAAPRPRLPILLGIGAAALYLARFAQLYAAGMRRVMSDAFTPIDERLVWLSAPIVAAYLYVVTRTLLADLTIRRILLALRSLRPLHIVLAAIVLLVPPMVAGALAKPDGRIPITGIEFAGFLTILPAVHPGRFLVAHINYFGPVLLLTVLFWPRVAQAIRGNGLGVAGATLLCCLVALSSESRQSTLAVPFLVVFTVMALGTVTVPRRVVAYVVGASVLVARPWARLSQPDAPHREWSNEEMLRFFRAYFDHQGPWISARGYFVGLLVVLALAAGLWIVWKLPLGARAGTRLSAPRPAP